MYRRSSRLAPAGSARTSKPRKADTPDAWVSCPACGRKAYLNKRDGVYVCMLLGCRGRVAAE